MTTCPHCNRAIPEDASIPSGNSERRITLEIPESQFALMRVVFREMNTKLGMHGLGELANQLTPFLKRFDDHMEHLRYFDDRAVAMAFTGVTWGYKVKVIIGKERPPVGVRPEPRVDVIIEFTGNDGSVKTLTIADNAIKPAAEWFKAYFEDAAERLTPMQDVNANADG